MSDNDFMRTSPKHPAVIAEVTAQAKAVAWLWEAHYLVTDQDTRELRRKAIDTLYAGGWAQFKADVLAGLV